MQTVRETDYRHFLNNEFERRVSVNPSYSLRAFARDLKVSPSTISEVLNGKHGLSKSKAATVAAHLGLSTEEKDNFIDMVEATDGRSEDKKISAIERINSREKSKYQPMNLDAFQVIKDWYHFAIIELTSLENFKSDYKWIADKLNLNQKVVEKAVERLLRLDLLILEGGKLFATDDYTAVGNQSHSEGIKHFHKQILQKAMDEIVMQPIEKREYSGSFMAIDKNEIDAAKKDLKKFRRSFSKKYEKTKNKNSIYCLSMQFFELTK